MGKKTYFQDTCLEKDYGYLVSFLFCFDLKSRHCFSKLLTSLASDYTSLSQNCLEKVYVKQNWCLAKMVILFPFCFVSI